MKKKNNAAEGPHTAIVRFNINGKGCLEWLLFILTFQKLAWAISQFFLITLNV